MSKYKFIILQVGSVLATLLLFIILNYFYTNRFSNDFQIYLATVSKDITNPNFFGEMLSVSAIVSMANSSLIMLFLFPMFMAIGVLSFVVYIFSKRLKILNEELKEIREKVNV